MKSFIAKPNEVERKWYVIDAEGKTLGRLSTEVATLLRGKHKPIYTPHVDTGDHVIIINCEKVVLTGKKLDQKMYRHHSGYMGGMKEIPYRKFMVDKSEEAVYLAVKGMLPKNRLGRQMIKKLRVYAGPEHENQAQKPEVYELNKRDIENYFNYETLRVVVKEPLVITDTLGQYDVLVNVHGGGYTGQAGAIRHGISRALLQADAELRPILKKAGFLTRDPRMKERKKYGLKKARKASQFSKR